MMLDCKLGLVSVIMPCFNSQDTIKSSIISVLNQKYENWELIICDDNSNDSSISEIEKFDDRRIVLLRNSYNKGAARTRNKALSVARGQYIAFLDSDDLWHEDKLKVQVDYMENHSCVLSYGDYDVIDLNDNIIGQFTSNSDIDFEKLCKTCDIGCLSVMIDHRKLVKPFSFPLSPKEDFAAWIVLSIQKGAHFGKFPGTYCKYRVGGRTLSSNKLKEIKKQYYVLRKYANLSVAKALYCLLFYILNGLSKHFLSYRRL
ncbi:glycosyltransferase family 2 protein [Vibrio lentus]